MIESWLRKLNSIFNEADLPGYVVVFSRFIDMILYRIDNAFHFPFFVTYIIIPVVFLWFLSQILVVIGVLLGVSGRVVVFRNGTDFAIVAFFRNSLIGLLILIGVILWIGFSLNDWRHGGGLLLIIHIWMTVSLLLLTVLMWWLCDRAWKDNGDIIGSAIAAYTKFMLGSLIVSSVVDSIAPTGETFQQRARTRARGVWSMLVYGPLIKRLAEARPVAPSRRKAWTRIAVWLVALAVPCLIARDFVVPDLVADYRDRSGLAPAPPNSTMNMGAAQREYISPSVVQHPAEASPLSSGLDMPSMGRSLGAERVAEPIAFDQAQQKAFAARVGDAIRWSEPSKGRTGVITVVRDGTDNSGHFCRELRFELASAPNPETVNRTYCEASYGVWKLADQGAEEPKPAQSIRTPQNSHR